MKILHFPLWRLVLADSQTLHTEGTEEHRGEQGYATSIFSSLSCLSASSVALQFERVGDGGFSFFYAVMTYEQPIQWASAWSVFDHWAGWSGWEW